MSEKLVKYIHKLCPCDSCDVEGIQSWLEDMAAGGPFFDRGRCVLRCILL